jgi:hypothetical protein
MKTTANIRFAVRTGLFLLSLLVLVLAVGLQAPLAMHADGAGVGGGATTVATSVPAPQLIAAEVRHAQIDRTAAYLVPTTAVQAASSGGISTTTWVILAVVVAMLAIAAWLLVRLRNRRGTAASRSAAFCSLHPDDVGCTAG